jgi:hypothetical protein
MRGDRHPEVIVGPAPCVATVIGLRYGREERLDRAAARLRVFRASCLDLRAIERVWHRSGEPRVEAGGIVRGVDSRGKRDDLHVEALPDGELHAAQRRRLAGEIAVEREHEALRQPAELT